MFQVGDKVIRKPAHQNGAYWQYANQVHTVIGLYDTTHIQLDTPDSVVVYWDADYFELAPQVADNNSAKCTHTNSNAIGEALHEVLDALFKHAESNPQSEVVACDPKSAAKMENSRVHASDLLEAAYKHMSDRAATYDSPEGERSMGKTVEAFNAITGHKLTEESGWMFMTLLKMVRSTQGDFKSDNYEDAVAYEALRGEAAHRARG